MASTLVGVVRYWQTATPANKFMWMTIIPTDDSELDNPSWTTDIYNPGSTGLTWSFDMVKISQATYASYPNFAAFQAAILAM